MKILYATNVFEDNMSRWQKYHIIDDLKNHGVEIVPLCLDHFGSVDDFNKAICEKSTTFDMFMTAYNEKRVYISTLKRLKESCVPTLLICFDNLVIPYVHKKVARYFDLVWLTSFETEYLFKKWGANTIFLPYAANPSLFCKSEEKINRMVFIGTPYGSRKKMLNAIINAGIGIDIFCKRRNLFQSNTSPSIGANPKKKKRTNFLYHLINKISFKVGRKLIVSSLKRRLSKATINLNASNVSLYEAVDVSELFKTYSKYSLGLSSSVAVNSGYLKKPVPIINLRNFEIPMSGVAQICLYNEELSKYFEENKEIIFYRNENDLIEKCKYYLDPNHYNELIQIGNKARERSLKEHTWFCRFRLVFEYFGLKGYHE